MVGKGKERCNGCVVENVGIGASRIGAHVVGSAVARGLLGEVAIGAGDHGIRDSRRSAGRDSHTRDNGVQAPAAGAVERHLGRDQQLVGTIIGDSGQSTVEFAVVMAGFLTVTVALGALWRALSDGLLVEHALAVASHHIQAVAPVTIVDIFLY